ncbi:MAG: hypothetical protein KatS3mg013_1912 [Actinomycetota bacterium]|nr:MAG: hypothetical protein KatS3mg013_1912 [Actinomycetota bacterium]
MSRRHRAKVLRAGAVGLALGIFQVMAAPLTQADPANSSASHETTAIPPGTYDYAQATELGIDTGPTPDETGLPVCKYDPDWGGLAPDESVPAEARDEPATCVADRTYVTYMIGASPPHAGYHWNGYRTNNDIAAGADVTIEIRDAQVDHLAHTSDEEEFVVNRTITQNTANDDWLEVGYGEHSWESADHPRVYTYVTRGSADNIWAWYGRYGLTNGNRLDVRTRNCTISGDDRQCAEVWWSNQWQLLTDDNNADCRGAAGNPRCYAEEMTEIYSQQSSPHPDITGSSGNNRIDWKDTMLRVDQTGGAVWISWTKPSTKSTQTAYDTCPINNYYRWYALKGSC